MRLKLLLICRGTQISESTDRDAEVTEFCPGIFILFPKSPIRVYNNLDFLLRYASR